MASKKAKRPLKLYVWEDVLIDYTPGVAFSLAPDAKTARRLCVKLANGKYTRGRIVEDLEKKPQSYTAKVRFEPCKPA